MDRDKMAKLALGHLVIHGPSKLDDIVKGIKKYFANHSCEEILPFLLHEIIKAKNGSLSGRVQIIDTTGDPLDNIYRVIPKGQAVFCATESCVNCGRDLICPKGCKQSNVQNVRQFQNRGLPLPLCEICKHQSTVTHHYASFVVNCNSVTIAAKIYHTMRC